MIGEILGRWAGQCASWNCLWNWLGAHKGIFQNFIQGGSFGRIENQNSFNELSGLFRNAYMIRETVVAGLDFFVSGLNFWGFKWWFSNQLGVNYDADGPDINLIRMSFSLKDLRSNIVGSSANGLFLFLIVLESGCESKVTQLDLHIFIQEQVTELKTMNKKKQLLSVDDFVDMEVLE